MLRTSPEIEVAGTARDGLEAVDLAVRLKPDVVTLDVEMPGMSGLEALPALLARQPPVVMVERPDAGRDAEVTLSALELGAVDFMPKPGRHQVAELKACRDLLISKRSSPPPRAASVPRAPRLPRNPGRSRHRSPRGRAVVLLLVLDDPLHRDRHLHGRSPGIEPDLAGPVAAGPADPHCPAHAAQFTNVFAERLDRQCSVTVKEAEEGDRVLPDQILIAAGGRHMTMIGRLPQVRIVLTSGPLVSGHRPSIDMLFQSAASVYGSSVVGFIMTGMGRDGVEGCKRILAAGGMTFGQDEATSVVYGMNKAAQTRGRPEAILPG